jgi:hypothetical protein
MVHHEVGRERGGLKIEKLKSFLTLNFKILNSIIKEFFFTLSGTFIACYLFMIIHCKFDIVFVQFFNMFPIFF